MGNEGLEQFGFVCSFLIFPLGALYQLWGMAPQDPGDSWTLALTNSGGHVATSALCLFVAVPLLYGMANRSKSPRIESIHNLVDHHTRQSKASSASSTTELEKEHVPAISDCPIAKVNEIMEKRLQG